MSAAETKARVLDAALASFGTRGFEATSLDAIAGDLGIRKQTILYWFPSKEAMLERFESRSGRSAKAFDYYELFAGFRFCVIMGRLAVIFKDWGLIPADNDMGQNNAPARLTEQMLNERGAA